MVKGGSLKAALVAQQAKAARKAAQVKVQEALERKEKSMSGGNKQKNRRDKQQEKNLSKMLAVTEAAEVSGEGKEKQPYRPRTLTYPFDATDTILLVGEGDFSYTLSILSPPHSHPAQRVLATAYDSEKECYEKYPSAEETVAKIRALGARVEFGLDAGAIEKCKAVGKAKTWSRIVFNFPHAGAGIKDQDRNILTNQHLLLTFFRSAAPFLTEGPSRFAINKNAKVKGRPNTLRKLGGEGVEEEEEMLVEDDEGAADMEGVVAEGEGAAGSDAGSQAEGEDDIGIDIDEYLAQNSKVEDLNAKPEPIAAQDTDPSAPPRTQGTILVTLKDSIPYTLWNLKALATRPADTLATHPAFAALNRNKTMGAQPRYTVCRSFAFVPDLYPGYAHVKTKGATAPNKREIDDVIARGTGGTRTWEFALKAWERRGGRNFRGKPRRPRD